MMSKLWMLLASCLSSLCLAAPPLQINTEDSPPFNMLVDGQITGSATAKIRALMHMAKLAYKIELMPWRRAYEDALRRDHTCVYSTTRTPERESLFKWVGPIAFNEWVLFGRSDSGIQLGKLEDARPYTIGAYNGDVRESYLRAREFKVETAVADAINPRKLMLGRIDLWVSGRYDGHVLISQGGYQGKIVPLLNFYRSELYLACNPQLDEQLIDRLNVLLAVMHRDGTITAIDEQYRNWPGPP
ncbi:substrate-binding periplasmic protein [Paucibacter soli]|uniref:substrate-binding periplasmic protein n=1 Tax=Paucibacter soli TaxID=3133433 RepID=UPI00309585E3